MTNAEGKISFHRRTRANEDGIVSRAIRPLVMTEPYVLVPSDFSPDWVPMMMDMVAFALLAVREPAITLLSPVPLRKVLPPNVILAPPLEPLLDRVPMAMLLPFELGLLISLDGCYSQPLRRDLR